MAASSKYGEAFDAEYVDNMMRKVLVRACAAITLNKPHDPIEYLSLWLHKYCDNAIILQNYECEKAHKAHKEAKEKEVILNKFLIEQELKQQQNSTLNYMQSITNDPYLLWNTCLKAITTYTGCQAAYIAVVVRKIFEPKPKKKKKVEGEEGEEEEEEVPDEHEEGEGKEEGSDTTSVDEESPEADEEKLEGEEGEGIEVEPEEEEEEKEKGEEEEKEPPPPKPFRIPKPLNYKNRRLLYVAATLPAHIHMLNRQMVIKSGPVTFSLLVEELPDLHVPNVLYKEGIHYFGGCPRVGAYFVAPMSIEYVAKKYLGEEFKERPPKMFDIVKQKQVIALLCCDTLKSDSMGNGRPFQQIELQFIRDCANTMSSILDENNKELKKGHNTPEVIQKFKDQLREIKLARVERLEIEKIEVTKRKKTKEKLRRLKRFQEAHKTWEERQAVKAKTQAKSERQKEKKRKKLEDAGQEVAEEEPLAKVIEEGEGGEDDDPEPVLEPGPEEDVLEKAVEEPPPPKTEEAKEGEEREDKEEKDEFNDEELEPNPLVEIQGEESEGGEEAPAEEEPEEEEESKEPDEPKEDEELPSEEAPSKGEVEKPKESEDAIKLKERKKTHAKKEKETKKTIKELIKLVKGFEKRRKKAIVALEKLTVEVEKYERALFIANGIVQYLRKHMQNAYNLLVENKLSELDRVRRWPYPNRHVQRILKALLHLLGHKKLAIDDWNSARKLFNSNLLDKVLKDYDPLITNDPQRWEDVDSYLTGLKDEKLPEEACIGFLLQQWILACKKTTTAGANYHKIKTKYEELSKDYATLEMEKIMCEVETQICDTKLKKMVDDEEARIEKEVDEIEAEEKRLADIVAQEITKKEEEDKMYAEYAAQVEAEAAELAAQGGEGGEEGGS